MKNLKLLYVNGSPFHHPGTKIGKDEDGYWVYACPHCDCGRVPQDGAIILVDLESFDGNKLVDVTWDGRKVMMFAQDLRIRAELLEDSKQADA